MSTAKRISQVLRSAKQIDFDDCSKIVLMSDCHRSNGSGADNFSKNQNLYYVALRHYDLDKFTYIELGDGDELWECKKFSDITMEYSHIFALLTNFFEAGRLHIVYGNHDMIKKQEKWVQGNLQQRREERTDRMIPLFPGIQVSEGIILRHRDTGHKILLMHGHQADFFNDALWRLSKFLVRNVWRPLELIGVRDPTSAANNHDRRMRVEEKLISWLKKEKMMLIAGHTHRPVFPKVGEPLYFNDGSCVHPRCITAIEIVRGEILLVKWSVITKPNGTLFVAREVLEGPVKLVDYFTA